MKNVLELIDGGFLGGGQTHILSIAGNIDKYRFNVFIAGAPDGQFKQEVTKRGYNYYDITLPKIYRGKYLHSLDSFIEDNKIDIIHSHGGVAGMYARFYKKKYNKVKVVHTIHGIHYTRTKNFLRKWFSHSVEQHLVKYTDKFICVSDEDLKLAEEIKITDPSKTSVIKNGIDIKRFANAKPNEELKKKLGLTGNDIVIGNISRFDFQKNQRLLIESFNEVLRTNKNAKLLLAGDGQFFNNCKQQVKHLEIQDKVIFTGEISNAEDYYPLIDAFIFPSLWEGLSITLIEAMASGRSIIASDIPSNRELINDGKNGLLFSLGDVTGLTEKILSLLNNPEERGRLSENAEKDASAYDEKEMAGKIMRIYSEV
jgi:glycosyltransferase involved in cell wall biosynthesis